MEKPGAETREGDERNETHATPYTVVSKACFLLGLAPPRQALMLSAPSHSRSNMRKDDDDDDDDNSFPKTILSQSPS